MSYSYTTNTTNVEFSNANSLVVYMALDCIDHGFSYEMYSSYMMQWATPTLPEPRYIELFNIVANN